MSRVDIAIVGAGIAGAGIAHALLARAPGLSITILEAEDVPGRHTTGRSAAFFAETYGGPGIQPLSTASRAFLEKPPADFSDHGFLGPRGGLHLMPPGGTELLAALEDEFRQGGIAFQRLGRTEIRRKLPFLADAWSETAIWEEGCRDIDVAGLHAAYLRSARKGGAVLVTDARVTALRQGTGGWSIGWRNGGLEAGAVVNAAGAWADEIAVLAGLPPVGLAPMRRTMLVAEVDPPAAEDLPLVMDMGGSFYFKPDSGRLWISPHDETPDVPRDTQPEELDVAIALDRFATACAWPVRRLAARWAGLRTFAPDRLPVLGPDPLAAGFIWCAGQGGWGIQTSPAASDLLAAEMLGEGSGLSSALYMPARFR